MSPIYVLSGLHAFIYSHSILIVIVLQTGALEPLVPPPQRSLYPLSSLITHFMELCIKTAILGSPTLRYTFRLANPERPFAKTPTRGRHAEEKRPRRRTTQIDHTPTGPGRKHRSRRTHRRRVPQHCHLTMKGSLRRSCALALALSTLAVASAFVSPSTSRASLPRSASLSSAETSTANDSYSAPALEIDRRRNLAIICETMFGRGDVCDVACH